MDELIGFKHSIWMVLLPKASRATVRKMHSSPVWKLHGPMTWNETRLLGLKVEKTRKQWVELPYSLQF